MSKSILLREYTFEQYATKIIFSCAIILKNHEVSTIKFFLKKIHFIILTNSNNNNPHFVQSFSAKYHFLFNCFHLKYSTRHFRVEIFLFKISAHEMQDVYVCINWFIHVIINLLKMLKHEVTCWIKKSVSQYSNVILCFLEICR